MQQIQQKLDMVGAAAAAGAVTGVIHQISEWAALVASVLAIVWFGIRFWDRYKGKGKGY